MTHVTRPKDGSADPLEDRSRERSARIAAFTEFVEQHGPRLKQALMAALGGEAGRDATAEALAWAWEHWQRFQTLDNPVGYLYRLGRNREVSVLRRRTPRHTMLVSETSEPRVEPGLEAALARLSEQQRTAVLLTQGFGWTYREVAEHLGVTISTVQTHATRGMDRLRHDLKVGAHD